MEVVWKKLIPIFGLCSFLFIDFAYANLKKEFLQKDNLNKTTCTFDSAQYYGTVFPKETRFCVDNANGTIFRYFK